MHIEGTPVQSEPLFTGELRRAFFKAACWAMERDDVRTLKALIGKGCVTLKSFRQDIVQTIPPQQRSGIETKIDKEDAERQLKEEADDYDNEDGDGEERKSKKSKRDKARV